MDNTALKVIYLVLSPKVPRKDKGKEDIGLGITWLWLLILLIATPLRALSQQGISAGGGPCTSTDGPCTCTLYIHVALVWSD